MKFYVGHNGNFDRAVIRALKEVKKEHPQITYYIVRYSLELKIDYNECETIFPEGLEKIPKRFALDRRNTWMVNNSNVVICYITRCHGGAHKFVKMAERRGLSVVNLAQC